MMDSPSRHVAIGRRSFLRHLGTGAVGAILGGLGVERWLTFWASTQEGAPLLPLLGRAVEPVTYTTSSGIRIHNLQTGYVAVKSAHRLYTGSDGGGIPAIAFDRSWTEWMPINTWVIEHPEGIVMVDTGESAQAMKKDYFNCDPFNQFFYTSFLRFAVTPEDEIGSQLTSLGIPVEDVRWVVQTHLHSDHMGGLKAVAGSEVIVSNEDLNSRTGTLPCHYPPGFAPTIAQFQPEPVGPFSISLPLTRDGKIRVVPTPGHTEGHQSVVLLEEDATWFFAGDTSFSEAQLKANQLGGIVANPAENRHTLARIRDLCADRPTVYLPSHDPESRTRLLAQSTVKL
jgi:glyoxylase-like metal-dependent hydrolase (beta-lactamase superfamily II)